MITPYERTLVDHLLRLPGKKALWTAAYLLTGKRLVRPTHYLAFSRFGAVFEADLERVAMRLRGLFSPVETQPGRCEVHIDALDYRDIDTLQPYRELAISTPAVCDFWEKRGEKGAYMIDLPVTTEEARWLGVRLYGFPKWVGDIRLLHREGERICRLFAGEDEVLEMVVKEPPVLATPSREVVRNYSIRGGEVVESTFALDGLMTTMDQPGGAVLHLGLHPAADALADLGISRSSTRHFVADELTGLLLTPKVVGVAPAVEIPVVSKELAA